MDNIKQRKIAVIVPVHNRREITLNYLRQMQEIEAADARLDIVIVDDGSTDGTADAVRALCPDAAILKGDGNLWWTGAVNMGVEYALKNGYDFILIMNDDLELDRGFLACLLNVADRNPGSLVSSVTVNRTETNQDVILTAGFKRAGFFGDMVTLHAGETCLGSLDEVIKCDFLTGASLLVPVEVFNKIGLFDAKNFPHGMGDFEFTLRASLDGCPCLVATGSRVYTEYNPKYPAWYFFSSSRREYLRNLFDSSKYYYGFKSIYKTSYMHRPFVLGTLLFLRRLLGLTKSIFLKLFLTRNGLRTYLVNRSVRTGAPEFLINKLRSSR